MKILITGASGLLGHYVTKKLSAENEVLSLYNNNKGILDNFNCLKCDITDKVKLGMIFSNFRPEIIIHTAAYSRAEICNELGSDEVYRLNVEATENIARHSKTYSSKLIYTSTDLVYDGNSGGMLTEEGKLNPITLYAESKLMGEIAVQNFAGKYIILRTALLLGFGMTQVTNNFQITYDKLKSGQKVNLFFDQFRTPLTLVRAADFIEYLCLQDLPNLLLNFGGNERVSRVQIGEMIAEAAGFDKSLINPISCKSIEGIPQVPDVSMNTGKLQSLGLKSLPLSEEINYLIKNNIQ